MDKVQRIQSEQYRFPYHFLPVFEADEVRLTRHWIWAPSYLAALYLVADWFAARSATRPGPLRHVDVGCGDGALLYHLSRRMGDVAEIEWTGIDYDERAIELARAMNGRRGTFIAEDIAQPRKELCEAFDSATLIEVAEHIPPDRLPAFVAAVRRLLRPGAELLVTVPHRNRRVEKKHYQHFDFAGLQASFEPHFECISIHGFGRQSWLSRMVSRAVMNRRYIFTWQPLTDFAVRTLARRRPDEQGVSRIIAVFRRTD